MSSPRSRLKFRRLGTAMSLFAMFGLATHIALGQPLPPGPTAGSPTLAVKSVHLRVDGKLAGKFVPPGGSSASRPSLAQVTVYQNGQVVNSTFTDELGNFQLDGLKPGNYVVKVDYLGSTSMTPLQVLPVDPTAPLDASTLELTVPPGTAPVDPPPLAAPMAPDAPMYGGGGGDGGGGLGMLGAALGAAGLGVGIAALATNNNNQASPFTP